MTIKKAVQMADELRPNAISTETKQRWVNELNSQIAEMMGVDVPPMVSEGDGLNEDLLMPYPYDNIYYLYVMAMINDGQEETSLYVNDMAVFNQAMSEAKAWWRRNNSHPKRINRFRGVWRH